MGVLLLCELCHHCTKDGVLYFDIRDTVRLRYRGLPNNFDKPPGHQIRVFARGYPMLLSEYRFEQDREGNDWNVLKYKDCLCVQVNGSK